MNNNEEVKKKIGVVSIITIIYTVLFTLLLIVAIGWCIFNINFGSYVDQQGASWILMFLIIYGPFALVLILASIISCLIDKKGKKFIKIIKNIVIVLIMLYPFIYIGSKYYESYKLQKINNNCCTDTNKEKVGIDVGKININIPSEMKEVEARRMNHSLTTKAFETNTSDGSICYIQISENKIDPELSDLGNFKNYNSNIDLDNLEHITINGKEWYSYTENNSNEKNKTYGIILDGTFYNNALYVIEFKESNEECNHLIKSALENINYKH